MGSKDSLSKGAISKLYTLLLSNSPENSDQKRNAWREDLETDISIEDWESVYAEVHTQSNNTSLRLLQYKWLMRTYITPVKLNQYNGNIPDLVEGDIISLCLAMQ